MSSEFAHYEEIGGGRVSAIETAPDGSTILRVHAAEGVWWDVRIKDAEAKADVAGRIAASLVLLNDGGDRALEFFRQGQAVFDGQAKAWLPVESHEAWAARVRGEKPEAKPATKLVHQPGEVARIPAHVAE